MNYVDIGVVLDTSDIDVTCICEWTNGIVFGCSNGQIYVYRLHGDNINFKLIYTIPVNKKKKAKKINAICYSKNKRYFIFSYDGGIHIAPLDLRNCPDIISTKFKCILGLCISFTNICFLSKKHVITFCLTLSDKKTPLSKKASITLTEDVINIMLNDNIACVATKQGSYSLVVCETGQVTKLFNCKLYMDPMSRCFTSIGLMGSDFILLSEDNTIFFMDALGSIVRTPIRYEGTENIKNIVVLDKQLIILVTSNSILAKNINEEENIFQQMPVENINEYCSFCTCKDVILLPVKGYIVSLSEIKHQTTCNINENSNYTVKKSTLSKYDNFSTVDSKIESCQEDSLGSISKTPIKKKQPKTLWNEIMSAKGQDQKIESLNNKTDKYLNKIDSLSVSDSTLDESHPYGKPIMKSSIHIEEKFESKEQIYDDIRKSSMNRKESKATVKENIFKLKIKDESEIMNVEMDENNDFVRNNSINKNIKSNQIDVESINYETMIITSSDESLNRENKVETNNQQGQEAEPECTTNSQYKNEIEITKLTETVNVESYSNQVVEGLVTDQYIDVDGIDENNCKCDDPENLQIENVGRFSSSSKLDISNDMCSENDPFDKITNNECQLDSVKSEISTRKRKNSETENEDKISVKTPKDDSVSEIDRCLPDVPCKVNVFHKEINNQISRHPSKSSNPPILPKKNKIIVEDLQIISNLLENQDSKRSSLDYSKKKRTQSKLEEIKQIKDKIKFKIQHKQKQKVKTETLESLDKFETGEININQEEISELRNKGEKSTILRKSHPKVRNAFSNIKRKSIQVLNNLNEDLKNNAQQLKQAFEVREESIKEEIDFEIKENIESDSTKLILSKNLNDETYQDFEVFADIYESRNIQISENKHKDNENELNACKNVIGDTKIDMYNENVEHLKILDKDEIESDENDEVSSINSNNDNNQNIENSLNASCDNKKKCKYQKRDSYTSIDKSVNENLDNKIHIFENYSNHQSLSHSITEIEIDDNSTIYNSQLNFNKLSNICTKIVKNMEAKITSLTCWDEGICLGYEDGTIELYKSTENKSSLTLYDSKNIYPKSIDCISFSSSLKLFAFVMEDHIYCYPIEFKVNERNEIYPNFIKTLEKCKIKTISKIILNKNGTELIFINKQTKFIICSIELGRKNVLNKIKEISIHNSITNFNILGDIICFSTNENLYFLLNIIDETIRPMFNCKTQSHDNGCREFNLINYHSTLIAVDNYNIFLLSPDNMIILMDQLGMVNKPPVQLAIDDFIENVHILYENVIVVTTLNYIYYGMLNSEWCDFNKILIVKENCSYNIKCNYNNQILYAINNAIMQIGSEYEEIMINNNTNQFISIKESKPTIKIEVEKVTENENETESKIREDLNIKLLKNLRDYKIKSFAIWDDGILTGSDSGILKLFQNGDETLVLLDSVLLSTYRKKAAKTIRHICYSKSRKYFIISSGTYLHIYPLNVQLKSNQNVLFNEEKCANFSLDDESIKTKMKCFDCLRLSTNTKTLCFLSKPNTIVHCSLTNDLKNPINKLSIIVLDYDLLNMKLYRKIACIATLAGSYSLVFLEKNNLKKLLNFKTDTSKIVIPPIGQCSSNFVLLSPDNTINIYDINGKLQYSPIELEETNIKELILLESNLLIVVAASTVLVKSMLKDSDFQKTSLENESECVLAGVSEDVTFMTRDNDIYQLSNVSNKCHDASNLRMRRSLKLSAKSSINKSRLRSVINEDFVTMNCIYQSESLDITAVEIWKVGLCVGFKDGSLKLCSYEFQTNDKIYQCDSRELFNKFERKSSIRKIIYVNRLKLMIIAAKQRLYIWTTVKKYTEKMEKFFVFKDNAYKTNYEYLDFLTLSSQDDSITFLTNRRCITYCKLVKGGDRLIHLVHNIQLKTNVVNMKVNDKFACIATDDGFYSIVSLENATISRLIASKSFKPNSPPIGNYSSNFITLTTESMLVVVDHNGNAVFPPFDVKGSNISDIIVLQKSLMIIVNFNSITVKPLTYETNDSQKVILHGSKNYIVYQDNAFIFTVDRIYRTIGVSLQERTNRLIKLNRLNEAISSLEKSSLYNTLSNDEIIMFKRKIDFEKAINYKINGDYDTSFNYFKLSKEGVIPIMDHFVYLLKNYELCDIEHLIDIQEVKSEAQMLIDFMNNQYKINHKKLCHALSMILNILYDPITLEKMLLSLFKFSNLTKNKRISTSRNRLLNTKSGEFRLYDVSIINKYKEFLNDEVTDIDMYLTLNKRYYALALVKLLQMDNHTAMDTLLHFIELGDVYDLHGILLEKLDTEIFISIFEKFDDYYFFSKYAIKIINYMKMDVMKLLIMQNYSKYVNNVPTSENSTHWDYEGIIQYLTDYPEIQSKFIMFLYDSRKIMFPEIVTKYILLHIEKNEEVSTIRMNLNNLLTKCIFDEELDNYDSEVVMDALEKFDQFFIEKATILAKREQFRKSLDLLLENNFPIDVIELFCKFILYRKKYENLQNSKSMYSHLISLIKIRGFPKPILLNLINKYGHYLDFCETVNHVENTCNISDMNHFITSTISLIRAQQTRQKFMNLLVDKNLDLNINFLSQKKKRSFKVNNQSKCSVCKEVFYEPIFISQYNQRNNAINLKHLYCNNLNLTK